MTYQDRQRLADIQAAIDAIRSINVDGDLPELERAIRAIGQSLPKDDPAN